jgi:hypothetical protein
VRESQSIQIQKRITAKICLKLPHQETDLVAHLSTKAANFFWNYSNKSTQYPQRPTTMVGLQPAHGRRKIVKLSLLIEGQNQQLSGQESSPIPMVGLQPAHGLRKIAKLSLLLEDKTPPLGARRSTNYDGRSSASSRTAKDRKTVSADRRQDSASRPEGRPTTMVSLQPAHGRRTIPKQPLLLKKRKPYRSRGRHSTNPDATEKLLWLRTPAPERAPSQLIPKCSPRTYRLLFRLVVGRRWRRVL